MFGWFLNWFQKSGAVAAEPRTQRGLWALVDAKDFEADRRVFQTANRSSEDAATAAAHDYFSVVGVPARNWTYSIEMPAECPAGYRWIPLEAGFGLKVRI